MKEEQEGKRANWTRGFEKGELNWHERRIRDKNMWL